MAEKCVETLFVGPQLPTPGTRRPEFFCADIGIRAQIFHLHFISLHTYTRGHVPEVYCARRRTFTRTKCRGLSDGARRWKICGLLIYAKVLCRIEFLVLSAAGQFYLIPTDIIIISRRRYFLFSWRRRRCPRWIPPAKNKRCQTDTTQVDRKRAENSVVFFFFFLSCDGKTESACSEERRGAAGPMLTTPNFLRHFFVFFRLRKPRKVQLDEQKKFDRLSGGECYCTVRAVHANVLYFLLKKKTKKKVFSRATFIRAYRHRHRCATLFEVYFVEIRRVPSLNIIIIMLVKKY